MSVDFNKDHVYLQLDPENIGKDIAGKDTDTVK